MGRYANFSSVELVNACAWAKDEDAWTEFIHRFQIVIAAAVLRTARQWGEPPSPQLDDLVQDTYLKLCESNSQLLRSFQSRHEESIYGFLKVVAANVVHDHFRSATAAKRGASQTEAITEIIQMDLRTPGADSFEVVRRSRQLEQVDRILREVTSGKDERRNRTIFWLRHQQGLTASEIASIPSIGLSTEGVESALMRMAAMIRGQIISAGSHREVKVFDRKNRSRRVGS